MNSELESCDTFVVLPPLTKYGCVVFGKNADRPQGEVQEVVYVKGGKRCSRTVQCTYITIEESENPVNSVVLSKPAWMWGAEMGSNDKNVVIGNEAVWTRSKSGEHDPKKKRLLGMDLLRLGLERGNSAEEALDVITSLLKKYGQGGPCSEFNENIFYHNSFLITDAKEAWVLETSGTMWAAEKIVSGFKNISNNLTITTKIDKCSENLQENAQELGFWDGTSVFNFNEVFSSSGENSRQREGKKLMEKYTKDSQFYVNSMMEVLRDRESGICRRYDDAFPTQGSQVSLLTPDAAIHWLTATPDPRISYFKPFIFGSAAKHSPFTIGSDEPDREHLLYTMHNDICFRNKDRDAVNTLRAMEISFNERVEFYHQQGTLSTVQEYNYEEAVENELAVYQQNRN